MKELLEACQKFISQISPSGDERFYDIDPQDLKGFCDSVEAVQQMRCKCGLVLTDEKYLNGIECECGLTTCLECGGSFEISEMDVEDASVIGEYVATDYYCPTCDNSNLYSMDEI